MNEDADLPSGERATQIRVKTEMTATGRIFVRRATEKETHPVCSEPGTINAVGCVSWISYETYKRLSGR